MDKTPDEGFTFEVLTQRSELLRLTADLLTDPESRREYENLLLNGSSGLEFSSNREVAGLILLWESGSPKEASFGEPDSQRSIKPATSLFEENSNPDEPFNNKFSYSLLLSGSVSKSAVKRSNSDLWVKTSNVKPSSGVLSNLN